MTSQRLDRQVSRLLDEIEQAVERGDWPDRRPRRGFLFTSVFLGFAWSEWQREDDPVTTDEQDAEARHGKNPVGGELLGESLFSGTCKKDGRDSFRAALRISFPGS